VKGKSEFGEGEFSTTSSFIAGYPTRPLITQPLHLSEGVSAKPLIGWDAEDDTDSIYAEFSEESDFSTLSHFETFDAATDTAQITASLEGFTWYYLQIQAENQFGRSVPSAKKYFMTGEGTGIQPTLLKQPQLLVYPTLFSDGTLHIRLTLCEPGNLNLQLFDQLGREIYQDVAYSLKGECSAEISIERDLFPAPGIYFVKLSNTRISVAELIIVQ